MLIGETEIRDVHGIPEEQKQRIIDFLQGAVYCWCKNRKDEWFTTRDLLGGDNYFWQGTPLFFCIKKQRMQNNQARMLDGCLKRLSIMINAVFKLRKRAWSDNIVGMEMKITIDCYLA